MGALRLPSTEARPVDYGSLLEFRDVDVVALDVDGTLLPDAVSTVSERIVEMHRLLASHPAPVDFVLVTGRPWAGVREVVAAFEEAAGRRAPHVVHFGSVVTDAVGRQALRRSPIPAEIVQQVVDVYRAHGLSASAIECGNDLQEAHWFVADTAGAGPESTYDFGVPIRRVRRLPDGVDSQAVLTKTEASTARRVLSDLASLGAGLPMEYHSPSGILYVDSQGSSKAEGLHRALAELGVPPNRAIAIGDATPDIAMFDSVRFGVAVGTASSDVLGAARYVCEGGPSRAVIEVLEVLIAARSEAFG
ncbi:MAG: HAD family hydrolase [Acidimicrobiales bacterium]